MGQALQLLRTRRHFRRLWAGNVVTQLGDWVGWVAVSVFALTQGGGVLDLALVFAAHHLPSALLTPVSGVIADRVDRRTMLVGTNLVLGVVTAGMVYAAARGSVAGLELLLILRSAIVAFIAPAERATLPRVVERAELVLAGALDAATWSVVFSLGMALGGVLSWLGPVTALALDTASFFVAAALFAGLPPVVPQRSAPQRRLPGPRAALADLGAALRYVWPRPQLRRAVFAKGPLALAAGAAWIALAVQAEALAVTAAGLGFGLLHAVRGIGTGVGPVLVARGTDRLRMWRHHYAIALVGIAVFGIGGGWPVLVVAAFAWGLGGGTNWVISTAQMQALAPDHVQARISAFDVIGFVVAMTIGVALAAVATAYGPGLAVAVPIVAAVAGAGWWILDRTTGPPSEPLRQPSRARL